MKQTDPLDTSRILAEASVGAFEYHSSVSSTQDVAYRLASQSAHWGRELPTLIVAEEQTAGRGRGSNQWYTSSGSLALSLIVSPAVYGLPSAPLPQASLACGMAVIETAESWTPAHGLGLHWPNDVYLMGKKLSGILIDVLPDGRHIIGIGVNVNNAFTTAPEDVQRRAISLTEIAGKRLDRTDVLLTLLSKLDHSLRSLAADAATFGEQFDNYCLQVGHELTIESAGRKTTGRCAGIAPDGALLLDTFSGRQTFYSGVLC